MKHIKKHWILYLFAVSTITLTVIDPNTEAILRGALAWFFINFILFVSGIIIYSGIFGGEVSYSSEGLIPQLKKLFSKKKS